MEKILFSKLIFIEKVRKKKKKRKINGEKKERKRLGENSRNYPTIVIQVVALFIYK